MSTAVLDAADGKKESEAVEGDEWSGARPRGI